MSHPMIPLHYNLKQLSHSSINLLHSCPRKYEIYKLSPPTGDMDGSDSEDLSFGKIIGLGIAEYFIHGDYNRAALKMFVAWKRILDDEDGAKKKKTFWWALFALDKIVELRKTRLAHYEIALINGVPAAELGFTIDLGDDFNYRGFCDLVLINRIKKIIAILEVKTTGSYYVHEAMYKNSGQGLGYGVVLDAITPMLGIDLQSSYTVEYAVYKSRSCEWEILPFVKTNAQRAIWIRQIILEKQLVEFYHGNGLFPMHGESCYSYSRPCGHFGTCQLSTKYLVGTGEVVEKREDDSKYAYKFSINDLIDAQLAQHEGV